MESGHFLIAGGGSRAPETSPPPYVRASVFGCSLIKEVHIGKTACKATFD